VGRGTGRQRNRWTGTGMLMGRGTGGQGDQVDSNTSGRVILECETGGQR
jgi:hypothetical protein